MSFEVKLPDLGDGIESGDVLDVLVSQGDEIQAEQGVIEIETDKATAEVPSPRAGKVAKIHVSSGQTVKIGEVLLTLEEAATKSEETTKGDQPTESAEEPQAKAEESAEKAAEPDTKESETEKTAAEESEPVPRESSSAPRRETSPAARESAEPAPSQVLAAVLDTPQHQDTIPAGPAIRRFAREVGVDLHKVAGTGHGGRITREDVLNVVRHANQAQQSPAQKETKSQAAADVEPMGPASLGERDKWGPVRTEKLSKIRRTIAQRMHESWSAVPRVTNFDDADVTELEHIRRSSKKDYEAKGFKLTSMPFVIKAVASALHSHPLINSALDMENDRVVYKDYVNVGIAIDTDRGLVVPSLRDADDMSIAEIVRALSSVVNKVREGKFSVDDLRGSTFTISNLGAIGGTYSTPIINIPEVAILLLGRSRKMPVVVDDQVQVRLMMPLSLSYDHRLVDGATASRFLNDVIELLESPSRLLLAP